MSRLHELTVTDIERLTSDSVCMSFDVPDALKSQFSFQPGQYLTLELDIDGGKERRSYSICSSLNESALKIGVKKVADGLVSTRLNDATSVGEQIHVLPPEGRFTPSLGGTHHYLLLASGSGITPCLSIAKSVLENEPESTITLIYGNRSVDTIMFRDELNDLKDTYTGRFLLTNLLSRETQDIDLFNGRLDGEKLSSLIARQLIDLNDFDAAFLCGPEAMINQLRVTLTDEGMSPEKIKFELFGTTQNKTNSGNAKNAENTAQVSIVIDGTQKVVPIDGTQQTILAAAQSAGMDLPFSCAGGMCCTCRCKIVEGEADMDVNYSLEKWEIEAGFTLACQARPKSKSVTVDFDAV